MARCSVPPPSHPAPRSPGHAEEGRRGLRAADATQPADRGSRAYLGLFETLTTLEVRRRALAGRSLVQCQYGTVLDRPFQRDTVMESPW